MTEAEQIRAMLRQDLAAFADPGEAVVIGEPAEDWASAEWIQNGRRRTAAFRLGLNPSFEDVLVHSDDGVIPYRTFLAGTAMADLRAVARNTVGVLGTEEPFVAALGIESPFDGDGEAPHEAAEPADQLILRLVVPAEARTSVVFLTADAGDGKTTLMTRVTVDRANAYLAGAAEQLWLYVDAQGSRLARLDQALAQALDEVRAPFPYHATAALVRVGALALVIDGFDELIGTTGSYDEAYGSLSTFLGSLNGSGSVVAVARSAYYEQEFATRVNRSIGFESESWELRPLTLLDWTEDERRAYVDAACRSAGQPLRADELHSQLELVFADTELRPLAGKPLFVSRITDLLLDGRSLAVGELPIDRLVNAYVEREVRQKLISPDGRPLIIHETFRGVMQELAEEMWRQESRGLSRGTVRELMTLLADMYELDDETTEVLKERLPYVAFLRAGHTQGSVAFEHELFFAYFLVQPLISALNSESDFALAQTLRRGRLPQTAASLAGREMRMANPHAVLSRLAEASVRAGLPVARQNAAAVTAGILAEISPASGLAIEHMDFVDMRVGGVELTGASLRDVELWGVDIRGVRIEQSTGHGVRLHDVLVDERTRLELEGVPLTAVTSVVARAESGALVTHYAPAEIQDILSRAGFPAARIDPPLRPVDNDVVILLEDLMRVFGHTNLITEEDPEMTRRIIGRHAWPQLKQALLASHVLQQERRGASGNKTFYRFRARPADVLAAQEADARPTSDIAELWRLLEARFPLTA